jgi:hypothetical protein
MSDVLKTVRNLLRKAEEVDGKKKPDEEPSYLLDGGEEGEVKPEPPGHFEGDEPGGKDHPEPDEDNYSPEHMKKYFARFLAEQPEYAREELKRVGMLAKASTSAMPVTSGLGKDRLNATAVMVDGTGWMKAVMDQNKSLIKAVEMVIASQGRLHSRLDVIEPLAKAAAYSGAESLSLSKAIGSAPMPVRGQQTGSPAPQADPNGLSHPIPLIKAELREAVRGGNQSAASLLNVLSAAHSDPKFLDTQAMSALRDFDSRIKK